MVPLNEKSEFDEETFFLFISQMPTKFMRVILYVNSTLRISEKKYRWLLNRFVHGE